MGFTLNQLEQERQIRKLQKKEDQDTKDYEQLTHLPKINNVELKGNKTSGDLGLSSAADIATVFSEDTNYTAGCYVYYEGTLYRFNADHSAGAWDPTDVVAANVTDGVVSNAAAIEGLTASDVAYDNTDSGLTATDVQGAMDELNNKFGTEKLIKEVTADGIKTYKDLFIELYASANNYSGFAQLRVDTAYFSPTSNVSFCRVGYGSNAFHFETIGIGSTNATYHKGDMSDNGTWTHTNISATVPSLGTKIGLYKCN